MDPKHSERDDEHMTRPDVPDPQSPEQTVAYTDRVEPVVDREAATQFDHSHEADDTGKRPREDHHETIVDSNPSFDSSSPEAAAATDEPSRKLHDSILQFSAHLSDSGLPTGGEETTKTLDGEQLAEAMLKRKQLTSYQLEMLRQGKGDSLVLGNYVIVDEIGAGGMGVVYKARHRRMKREVAVKVLPEALTNSKEALARFHREVEMAAKLHHPNIAAAFDADEAGGKHFLVMEYVDGWELSRYVKEFGPLPLRYAVALTIQAANGLHHAHGLGVIHRDIKPGNLLVNHEGRLKILDMGLAHVMEDDAAAGSELTQSGRVMGTVDYMAPEQAKDAKRADHRADVYSLGCTLFYLATGKPLSPKGSVTEKLLWHQTEEKPLLSSVCPASNDKLDAFLAKMLEKNPDDRPQSMQEVIVNLQERLKEIPPSGDRATVTGPLAAMPVFDQPLSDPAIASSLTEMAQTITELKQSEQLQQQEQQQQQRPGIGKLIAVALAIAAVVFLVVAVMPPLLSDKSKKAANDQASGETPANSDSTGSGATTAQVATDGARPDDENGGGRAAVIPPPVNKNIARLNEQIKWIFDHDGSVTVVTSGGIKRHAVTQPEELPNVPYDVSGVKFSNAPVGDEQLQRLVDLKGLQQLELAQTAVTDDGLAVLRQLTGLWTLDLSKTKVGDAGVNNVRAIKDLRDLNLSGSQISDAAVSQLSGLSKLENLYLADTSIGDDGVAPLQTLPSLRYVSLRGTKVTADGLFLLRRALPKLEVDWEGADPQHVAARQLIQDGAVLALETPTDTKPRLIAKVGDLPGEQFRIIGVDLSGNPKVTDGDVALLDKLPHIAQLKLDGTNVTDKGIAALAKIQTLQAIHLGSLRIAPATIAQLKQALPGCDVIEKPTDRWATTRWVLANGGSVTAVLPDGQAIAEIVDPVQVPAGPFVLSEAHLADRPKLTDSDLERFRGLSDLEVLDISGSGVTDAGIAHLVGCTKLRDLDLSHTKITDTCAAIVARMQSLRQLHLAGTDYSGTGLKQLGALEGLTHLSLADTAVDDSDLVYLKSFPKLDWLSLSGTAISDAAKPSLAGLKTLRKLLVDQTQVTDAGLEELQAMMTACDVAGDAPDPQRLALRWVLQRRGVAVIAADNGTTTIDKLTQLPRDDCKVLAIDLSLLGERIGPEGLDPLAGCVDLAELNLQETETDDRALAATANLAALRQINLAKTNVSNAGLQHLGKLKSLESVDLSETRVTNLQHLDGLQNLRNLDLNYCRLEGKDLGRLPMHTGLKSVSLNYVRSFSDDTLTALKPLTGLERLELAGTSISDAAMDQIVAFNKLRDLDLSSTKITDAGAAKLSGLSQLEQLRLNSTKVGDGALQALAQIKTLKHVDVVGTSVSASGVAALKAAIPGVTVLNGKRREEEDRRLQRRPGEAEGPRLLPSGGRFR